VEDTLLAPCSHVRGRSQGIAKLVTVQRGLVAAEIQHRKETRFAITRRLHQPCMRAVRTGAS
jgi:hypothetical protein